MYLCLYLLVDETILWHLLIYNIHTIDRELNIGHGHLPMPIIIIIETLSRTDL